MIYATRKLVPCLPALKKLIIVHQSSPGGEIEGFDAIHHEHFSLPTYDWKATDPFLPEVDDSTSDSSVL